MSLRPQLIAPVPDETIRVARAAFPQGTIYIRLRDELGVLFADTDFAALFPTRGRPAEAPWRLAMVTIMQYVEGLSDRAAADAVRSRIDWKYALSLELTDPGFDGTVLCEFRARLIDGDAEHLLLDKLLAVCRERKWLKARGRQRTDSTQVLAAVRALNRLQCVGETLRHTLNSLAVIAPEWLRRHSPAEWVERYAERAVDYPVAVGKEKRRALAEQIGDDGDRLLSAIYAVETPAWLREVPAVETLRRVWLQQFRLCDGVLRWRTGDEGFPPARLMISSPYDPDARFARKGAVQWVGYKAHLTETCDDDSPRLITDVRTAAAPAPDGEATPHVHGALAGKDLLPDKHIVDAGYVDAELLVTSRRDYDVDLLGPTRADSGWRARDRAGFAASDFLIDWEGKRVTCPRGRTSIKWKPALDRDRNAVIQVYFSPSHCQPCPSRALCATGAARTLYFRQQPHHEALQEARRREETDEYKAEYRKRAGVEGTISQAVRACGLRRARYIGEAKTHLQHVATAAAINVVRITNWLADVPLAKTRQTTFQRLMAQPATG